MQPALGQVQVLRLDWVLDPMVLIPVAPALVVQVPTRLPVQVVQDQVLVELVRAEQEQLAVELGQVKVPEALKVARATEMIA